MAREVPVMMKQAFVLLNHTLTGAQVAELEQRFGAEKIVNIPEDLQKRWANVPPEIESLEGWLQPFRDFLSAAGKSDDIAVIQGDFGATFSLVNFSLSLGLVPLYAASKRESSENTKGKKISLFRHVKFRRYR